MASRERKRPSLFDNLSKARSQLARKQRPDLEPVGAEDSREPITSESSSASRRYLVKRNAADHQILALRVVELPCQTLLIHGTQIDKYV